jgi:hypothetical protein
MLSLFHRRSNDHNAPQAIAMIALEQRPTCPGATTTYLGTTIIHRTMRTLAFCLLLCLKKLKSSPSDLVGTFELSETEGARYGG